MADKDGDARPAPVIEVAISLQFSPLPKLTSAHHGWFWREVLGAEGWPNVQQALTILDQFESFGAQSAAGPLPFVFEQHLGRTLFLASSRERQVQLQSTRYAENWLRGGGTYPGYAALMAEFATGFERFAAFVKQADLGEIRPNQWELTYIDSFPRGMDWDNAAHWTAVLPGLFGSPQPPSLELEDRRAAWSFVDPEAQVRVRVNASRALVNSHETLLLETTARGPLETDEDWRARFDAGHDRIGKAFQQALGGNAAANTEVTPC